MIQKEVLHYIQEELGKTDMKLYLLSTKALGEFYVVAKDATDSENKLAGMLNKADHGFLRDRQVENIKFIATAISEEGNAIVNIKYNRLLL